MTAGNDLPTSHDHAAEGAAPARAHARFSFLDGFAHESFGVHWQKPSTLDAGHPCDNGITVGEIPNAKSPNPKKISNCQSTHRIEGLLVSRGFLGAPAADGARLLLGDLPWNSGPENSVRGGRGRGRGSLPAATIGAWRT
jgi:hypothetical protein